MPNQSIKVIDEPDVVRFSSISVNSGLMPRRIVVRDLGRKFVVHTETMFIELINGVVTFKHFAFDNGNYFDYNEVNNVKRARAYEKATDCFNERCKFLL